MSEIPSSPEDRRASYFVPDPDSMFSLPEYDAYLDVPIGEEIPALEAWEEQNADALSKLSKRKQRKAISDALQELRAQRAREQIQASSPDEAAGPDTAGGEGV